MSQRVLRVVFGLGLGVLAVWRGELLFERVNLLLVLEDDVDAADGGADAGLQDLFGELFLVEGNDFLDVADAAAQVFAETDDLADDDGRARDGLHDAELSALDALGDFDFALAGEQRNGAHLAEVHADGVVGLLERAGREVEFYVVGLFSGLGLVLLAVAGELVAGEDIDALGVDGGKKVIEIVGRGDVTGQEVVDLAVGEIALFLAGVDELLYVVFVLVNFFSHGCAHSCKNSDDWDAACSLWWYSSGGIPGLLRNGQGANCGLDRVGKPDDLRRSGHSKAHVPSESQNTTTFRRSARKKDS